MRPVLKSIPLIVEIPLVLVTTAGLMAAYLNPATFWWAAVAAILLPAWAILLAVTAPLLVLARLHWWASLNVVLVVLVLGRLGTFDRLGSSPEIGAQDLVIMTFSVPRFGESAEVLAQNVLDLLSAERPHLVALQETVAWRLDDAPAVPRIADYVRPALDSLGYVLAIPARLDERTPLPILTRSADGPVVLEQQPGTLSAEPESLGQSRFVRTHLRWRGREAVLYNVHLRGYGSEKPWDYDDFPLLRPRRWLPFIARYREAFQLRALETRRLAELIESEELPVLLAGDLNVTSANWDYRLLARGKTDAFRAAGKGWGGTYRGDLPVVRIDYILADTAFAVTSAHVPDVRFSDHRPVVARLRWTDPPGSSSEPRRTP